MTNEPTIYVEIENLRDLIASIDDNGELYPGEKARVEARLAATLVAFADARAKMKE
jgi:hypothetical protein